MSKRDIIGPRMSSSTLGEATGTAVQVLETEEERAPARRVTFFDLPDVQRPLRMLDGWGWAELGSSKSVVARYKLSSAHGLAQSWPADVALLHASVDKVLTKIGRPPLLVAYLRHRYPREGGAHRGSVDAFHHPALGAFQEVLGASDREIAELMLAVEKKFIRRLARNR